MMTQNPLMASSQEMIRALVADKFAAFLDLEQRGIVFSSKRGAVMRKIYCEERSTATQLYTLHLQTLSPAELEAAVRKMHDEIARRLPRDERLFFNEPFAAAAYYHWAPQLSWSLEECAALLLGKDPYVVNTESLKSLVGSSEFATQFVRLLYRLQEAKEQGELSKCVSPEQILEWAQAHQIEVPLELTRSIEAYAADREAAAAQFRKEWFGEADDDIKSKHAPTPHDWTASAKKLASLEKMVIAMAVDWYGYDPCAGKSDVPKKIVDALERLGIPMSADTVRTRLQAAAEHIERDRIYKRASEKYPKR